MPAGKRSQLVPRVFLQGVGKKRDPRTEVVKKPNGPGVLLISPVHPHSPVPFHSTCNILVRKLSSLPPVTERRFVTSLHGSKVRITFNTYRRKFRHFSVTWINHVRQSTSVGLKSKIEKINKSVLLHRLPRFKAVTKAPKLVTQAPNIKFKLTKI